jgi:hypothetical protein
VNVKSLRFETPELEKKFFSFDKAARNFAADDFAYQPYYELGTFVPAVWTKGIGFEEPCEFGGSLRTPHNIHRITVEAIIAPLPHARGVGLSIETVGANPDTWCVSFWYSEAKNQHVVTPAWHITFFRWNPAHLTRTGFRPIDEAKEEVTLPLRSYTVRNSEVEIKSDVSIETDFVSHVISATKMRDEYLVDLDRLEKRVVKLIQGHEAKKEVFDKVVGHGIFQIYHSEPRPPSHFEPLSENEEIAELAKAKQKFTKLRKLINDYHEAMYAAFRKSFPVERCWAELKTE